MQKSPNILNTDSLFGIKKKSILWSNDVYSLQNPSVPSQAWDLYPNTWDHMCSRDESILTSGHP